MKVIVLMIIQERDFWSKNDSSEYLNWKNAERALFPNLKPSTKSISLRLPKSLLDALRQLANERDVPYQSLIKMYLQEWIEEDFKSRQGLSKKAESKRQK